jgi:adhesin transport system outer membrane protein
MKQKQMVLANAALLIGFATALPSQAATLQDAVTHTLSTNPQIMQWVNERRARDQEVLQAKAGYKPKVDFMGGVGYEWSNNPSTRAAGPDDDEEMTRTELQLLLRQMIYDGNATDNEVDRQQARVKSAARKITGVAQDTALRAVETYLELLKQQELLELARDNLDAHIRIYDQIKLRSESGVGRKADLAQIEGRVALAKSNVVAAKNNVNEAEANYRRVIGEASNQLQRPQGLADILPATVEEAVAKGLEVHPTLQSAQADVEATQAQHRASKYNHRPRFDLEVGRTWNNDLDGVDGRNEDFTAMLRVRWNLYNGGYDDARVEETAHLINESIEVQNNTGREVEEAVRLSWTSYEATKSQLDFLRKHMESSKQTREAYTKQFNIGQRTLLDLLDTENEVFESSSAHTVADYTNLYAQFRILTGMGVLLDSLAVSPPQEAVLSAK